MIKSLLKYFVWILLFVSCSRRDQNKEAPNELFSDPLIVDLNTEEGYFINRFSGDSIKPVINSHGDTIQTGIVLKIQGDHIHTDSVALPLNYPATNESQLTKKLAHPNIFEVNDGLPTFSINEDALNVVSFKEMIQDKSKNIILNTTGDSIRTGVSVPITGDTVPFTRPLPLPALPPRCKDNASMDIQYLDIEQGLSSSKVHSIIQDKRGNIWFGTWGGGISIYNGRSFINLSEKNGLSNNVVVSLLKDQKGNIWVATYGGGLNMYNGKQIIQYTEENGLPSNAVLSLEEDQKGNIWVGTSLGLVKIKNEKLIIRYTENEGLSDNFIVSVFEDDEGNIWAGTYNKGVNKFNGKTFTHYTTEDGLSNKHVRSIIEDKEGKMWFGTWGGGVSIYDGEKITHIKESEGLSTNYIWTVFEDRKGQIWIGCNDGGVYKYDGEFLHQISDDQGLSDISVKSIFEDESGRLWFGTSGGGVSIYDQSSFYNYTEKHGLSESNIRAIYQDQNENLWFGANEKGVCRYDGEKFTQYTRQDGLSNGYIRSIIEDEDGNLWLGTWGNGVNKFDGKSFTYFTTDQGLSNNIVWSMEKDKNGNLWFGTWGGGVSMFDGNSFTHFNEGNGLSNNFIWDLHEDQEGNLWFATNGGGVIKYNGESIIHYTEKEGLSSNTVVSILEDMNGRMWFATNGGGVNMFNGESFSYYSEDQGLLDNSVQSAMQDFHGDIWFSTDKGINQFVMDDPLAENIPSRINSYQKLDGLKGIEFFSNSNYADKQNRLWWGSEKSLTMLDVDESKVASNPPKVYLKQLDINNHFYDYHNLSDSISNEIIFDEVAPFENYPIGLELPYHKNHLTFHFAAIDWFAPHKIKYSYLMDGLNNEWSKPTSDGKADYRNLPYGTFTFKVRAIGESGEWSDPYQYSFKINPPWWHTWWARSAYLLIGLLLIYATIRWRTAKLKKRQEELESEVDKATKEIRQQKEVIEETHKEITDSINYAERIQRSFLATQDILDNNLKEYFVYFNPKEAVSGDFYWADRLSNGDFALVNADSTGHGVPGAIMSILNISSIEKAIEHGALDPADIFNQTRKTIIDRLSKDNSEEGGKDGMDASLICFNADKSRMKYVAAQNPIWIIRCGELIDIKAEKMPVGKHDLDHIEFKGGEMQLEKGDVIYTMTDGFQDQFGGEKGKKFKVKPMKRLFLEITDLPMKQQYIKIAETFEKWKGELEQIDDVCVIGVRV